MNSSAHIITHNQEKLNPHPRLSSAFAVGQQTGTIYNLNASSLEYNDDYFLSEYESQYGRTYLQDEENLRSMARKRLQRIQRLLPAPAKLLEIGCATGFFLDEARKLGYDVEGYEISNFASKYAREQLDLNVHSRNIFKDFKAQKLKKASQQIVCAFYTVEHFDDQIQTMQLISDLLQNRGVFAFALPSFHGPVLEFHPEQWEDTHPQDHFVDYDPHSLRKVLHLYNLSLLQTYPASYHQMRCKGIKALLPGPLYQLYANHFSYGDTMEGLARKIDPA